MPEPLRSSKRRRLCLCFVLAPSLPPEVRHLRCAPPVRSLRCNVVFDVLATRGDMICMVGWFAGGTGSHRRWAPRQAGASCGAACAAWACSSSSSSGSSSSGSRSSSCRSCSSSSSCRGRGLFRGRGGWRRHQRPARARPGRQRAGACCVAFHLHYRGGL
eukprot:8964741-Pyramimonas_sp.AAC.2